MTAISMGLGLGTAGGLPGGGWDTLGADIHFDWLHGRYHGGELSLLRSSGATDHDATGIPAHFPAHGLRQASGRGALLEAAGANTILESGISNVAGGSGTLTPVPPVGAVGLMEYSAALPVEPEVIYGAQRFYTPSAGNPLAMSVFVDPGACRYIYMTSNNESTEPHVGALGRFDTHTLQWELVQMRTQSALATPRIERFGPLYRVSFVWTADVNSGAKSVGVFCTDELMNRSGAVVATLEGFSQAPPSSFKVGGWQVEADGAVSSYIPTGPSPATRAADLLTVPTEDGARAFVLDLEMLSPVVSGGAFRNMLSYANSSGSNRYLYRIQANGVIQPGFVLNSSSSYIAGGGQMALGRNVIYGVFSGTYIRGGRVGWTDGNVLTPPSAPPGLSLLTLGNNTFTSAPNHFNARYRRFAEFRHPADPEAAFAQVKALAEAWAQ